MTQTTDRIRLASVGENGPRQALFRCPGCSGFHAVNVGEGHAPGRPLWAWNGSMEAPTFSPSVLLRTGHYVSSEQGSGRDCWCTYEQRVGRKAPFACVVCHSFVADGQIQFLSDCTHALAGQTVPLPPAREREDVNA